LRRGGLPGSAEGQQQQRACCRLLSTILCRRLCFRTLQQQAQQRLVVPLLGEHRQLA